MRGSRTTFVAAVLVAAVVGTAAGGPVVFGATDGPVALGATDGPVALGATSGYVALGATSGYVAPSATGGLAPAGTTRDVVADGATNGLIADGTTNGLVADGATNGLAEFSLKPGGTVASPGETLRLLVFLRSSPQVASGAYEASFVLGFDTEGLRVTNVTRGRFMSQGEPTTVRVNRSVVDNEVGQVRYGLVRDPPAGGVTGLARFATVTFEVRADAPAGTYDVVFRRTSVLLTDGGYQQVTSYGASVTVSPSATEATTETVRSGVLAGGGGDGGWTVTLLALLGTAVLVGGVVVLVRRA